jgi:hypothetical protein
MTILPKAIYMFNAIPIKMPMTFITEVEKSTLIFIWKRKRLLRARQYSAKRAMLEGITILDFKLYYKAISIKTGCYWHKNRHEDQWNNIEDPNMNLHNYAHLIFNKGAKNIQWRKDSLFSKYCCEKWLLSAKN